MYAGRSVGLTHLVISHWIGALLGWLKLSLSQRHTRGLIPTEQRETVLSTMHVLLAKLAMIEEILTKEPDCASGRSVAELLDWAVCALTTRDAFAMRALSQDGLNRSLYLAQRREWGRVNCNCKSFASCS